MAKTIFLHIGHPKTGSSFLQSVLAGNVDTLRSHGISYPPPPRAEKAAAGNISAGNPLELEKFIADPALLKSSPEGSILISGESLFVSMTQPAFQQSFIELIEKAELTKVEILLFLRDPVSYASSAYQQVIKRGSSSGTSLESAFQINNQPERVNVVLDFLDTQPKVNLTVRNYSAVRLTLLDELCAWLGIPKDALAEPPAKVVNRSMTASELMVLSAMNAVSDASAAVLADAWCNRLPDVLSDDMRPPLETQLALWARLAPEIERVNARVDPAHRYDRSRDINPPRENSEMAQFSQAQIGVLGEVLAELVDKVRVGAERNADLVTKMRAMRERNQALIQRLDAYRAKAAADKAQAPIVASKNRDDDQ